MGRRSSGTSSDSPIFIRLRILNATSSKSSGNPGSNPGTTSSFCFTLVLRCRLNCDKRRIWSTFFWPHIWVQRTPRILEAEGSYNVRVWFYFLLTSHAMHSYPCYQSYINWPCLNNQTPMPRRSRLQEPSMRSKHPQICTWTSSLTSPQSHS